MATFFQVVGLAIVAKTCPHRPQAIEKAKNGRAFPLEKLFFIFFLNESTAGKTFHASIRRSDLPMFNIR